MCILYAIVGKHSSLFRYGVKDQDEHRVALDALPTMSRRERADSIAKTVQPEKATAY